MEYEELQKRRNTFQTGAAAFEQYRPGYPDLAVDLIVPHGATSMVDIGAGTGKLTRELVKRVPEVFAVDPSEDMLDQLKMHVPQAHTIHGTVEYLPMDTDTVDAAVCANSWHWMDRAVATAEIARILKPGGTFSIIWSSEKRVGDWHKFFEQLVPSASANEHSLRASIPGPDAPFTMRERTCIPWEWTISTDHLVNLYMTHSAIRSMSPREQKSKLTQLTSAVATHPDLADGEVRLAMVTEAWVYTV